jgi:hypothetical protein
MGSAGCCICVQVVFASGSVVLMLTERARIFRCSDVAHQ